MADALYVLPESLKSILNGIEGAIALLNDTFSEARAARWGVHSVGQGGRVGRAAGGRRWAAGGLPSHCRAVQPSNRVRCPALLQTIEDIEDAYEAPTMAIEERWRFIPIAGAARRGRRAGGGLQRACLPSPRPSWG